MRMHMYMYMCMCMCVHMWVDTPVSPGGPAHPCFAGTDEISLVREPDATVSQRETAAGCAGCGPRVGGVPKAPPTAAATAAAAPLIAEAALAESDIARSERMVSDEDGGGNI